MKSSEIRSLFIDYFESKGHTLAEPSASEYTRTVTCRKYVRTGGKHKPFIDS